MMEAEKDISIGEGSTAIQGQGPSVHQGGQLVKMDLIIAGTNPLATDMTAAYLMGFQPEEISTFVWAWKTGMTQGSLNEIEISGEEFNKIRQNFLRPTVYPWAAISAYGPPC